MIPFGLPVIDKDEEFPPIMAGNLIVVAARPGVGKTAFALQMAENATKRGFKVLFFPLEMTGAEMACRVVKRRTEIDSAKLSHGNMGENEYGIINVLADTIGYSNGLYFAEGVRHLSRIRAMIRQEHPDIIFIDQLSQIEPEIRVNSIREKFVYVTKQLKALAIKENVPIVLLAQINREAARGADEFERFKLPTLSNLKESGSIEEDADCVLIIQTAEHVEAIENFNFELGNLFHGYPQPSEAIPAILSFEKLRDGRRRIFPAWYQGAKFAFRPLNVREWD